MPYEQRNPLAGGYHEEIGRAAIPSTERMRVIYARILGALETRGTLTADEIAQLLGEDRLAIRPRMTELLDAEKIYRTGDRRRNESGRFAAVYAATG